MIYTALDICSLRPIKCDSFAQIMFSSNSQGSSSLNWERLVAMEEFFHVSHTSNHTNCFVMEFTVNPWGKGWPIAGGGWGVGTAPKSCVQNASLRPVCTWRGMLSLSLPHTRTHTHTQTSPDRQSEVGACLGIFFLNLCVSAVETRVLAEALLCHGNTNF